MGSKNSKVLKWFLIDLACILAVGIPVLLLYLFGKPHIRGFFCNDESIRHPFHPSTVPSSAMIPINYITPILTFLLVETFNFKSSYKPALSQSYHHTKIFCFGALSTTLLTDVTKYTVGRPRPHFIEVCNPNIDFDNKTCGTDAQPKYVTDYECKGNMTLFPNKKDREKKMKASRLSFCSGHASLTWFAMLYTAMFLQWRLMLTEEKKYMVLLKAICQLGCLIFALYTSMTRISDYKHHPGDVLAGSVLGVVWAVIIFSWVSGINRGGGGRGEAPVETTSLMAKSGPASEHNV